jgi:endonuclease/exonuclease/phosphatase family metal-dependent hydrolase
LLAFAVLTAVAGCAVQPRMVVPAGESACRTIRSSVPITWTWISPVERRDVLRLDAWCRTVGPVVVEPLPAGRNVSDRPAADGRHAEAARRSGTVADEITIVSWNVHVGGGDIEALVADLRRGTFTREAPVRHFVLLLQEVYRRGPEVPVNVAAGFRLPRTFKTGERRDIREVAASLDLAVAYAPAMRNSEGSDRGNAVLSTLPLDDLLIVELPFEKQRRVAIAAAIRGVATIGGSWRLHVATMHFDTGVALTRGGPIAARHRQARALVDALASLAPPVVIGGDLNTWWGDEEPAVEELQRAFPDAKRPPARFTWRGPLGAEGKLDYVFARTDAGPLDVRRLPERFGSDHYPLMTLVNVSGVK